MIIIRPAQERGVSRESWLESRHSFSFHTYHDPRHMGFRSLRVINEDRVRAGSGFPMHEHRDMEIMSVVFSGALEHRDSLGRRETISAGQMQLFSAGSGIRHSEYNPSSTMDVHFLQIWILPSQQNLSPGYQKTAFELSSSGQLQLLASPRAVNTTPVIHQDAALFFGFLEPGEDLEYPLGHSRHAWLQMIEGELRLNSHTLRAGDGAAMSEEVRLRLLPQQDSRFLLFDLG